LFLTIGIIVKNEEKNLERCLESLKPIREAFETELIIVDTGSVDDTVRIAEKYADEVRHFEWVKDFSAARNASLEGARGEWFMYIDADEWFGDCTDLIEFFRTGEYKEHDTATYIQRNYSSENINGCYSDSMPLRLTKIFADTKFVNPIHEHLNTACKSLKRLSSFVHHFGYLEFKKQDSQKRERNIEILLKELKRNDSSVYLQLYEVLHGYDNAKAIEYAREGIRLSERTGDNIYMPFILRKLIALAYHNSGEFEKAAAVTDEYFSKRKAAKGVEAVILSDMDMHALRAIVFCKLDASKAAAAFEKYAALYKKFKQGEINTRDMYFDTLRFANDNQFVNVSCMLISALVEAGDYKAALALRGNAPYSSVISCFGYEAAKTRIAQDLRLVSQIPDYSCFNELWLELKDEKEAFPLLCSEILREASELNIEAFTPAQCAQIANYALESLKAMNEYDSGIMDLFVKYAYIAMTRINKLCKPEMINDEMILCLPRDLKLGYYCFMAASAFDGRDVKACVGYMKKAAILEIGLKKVVSAMGKAF